MLIEKKGDLRGGARFEEFAAQGLGMISQITDTITEGQMPYLAKIPLVKQEYDRVIGNMSPEQQANPASRKAAYDLACGTNMAEITKVQQEEWQRGVEKGEIEVQIPGHPKPGEETLPVKVEINKTFGDGSEEALKAVGNRSPDRVAQAFGFKNTADMATFSDEVDEYELTGKRKSEGGTE